MRFFLDTEFHEDGVTIDLISIALVAEDGRELYLVSEEWDTRRASENEWLVKNVCVHLPPRDTWLTREAIREQILDFIGPDKPEFWAYFADYDWVVLCQLFGKMIDLPTGWPMFCLDIKQEMKRLGVTKDTLPPQPENAHDALADARWVKAAWEEVQTREGCAECGSNTGIVYCSRKCADAA